MKVHNSKQSTKNKKLPKRQRGIIHHTALYLSKEEVQNLAVRWF